MAPTHPRTNTLDELNEALAQFGQALAAAELLRREREREAREGLVYEGLHRVTEQ